MTTIFLRNDDVGELTPALRHFDALLAERALPVSYQVIPAKLTDECATWLRERVSEGRAEIGQHGHTHEMVVNGRQEFYEFGPERHFDAQREVIAKGRAIMDAKLGDCWNRALFTPPRHRFNRDTLKALASLGFGLLSSSAYQRPHHRIVYAAGRALGLTNLARRGVAWHGRVRPEAPLRELSIAVAADDGHVPEGGDDALMARVVEARRHTPVVGVMFHHDAWTGIEDRRRLVRFLDRLSKLDGVRFATIGDAARELQ